MNESNRFLRRLLSQRGSYPIIAAAAASDQLHFPVTLFEHVGDVYRRVETAADHDCAGIEELRLAYYLIGTADRKRDRFLSMLQGDNRYDRWEKFRRYGGLFPEWHSRTVFAEVLGAGHSSAQMFDSRAARRAMFE